MSDDSNRSPYRDDDDMRDPLPSDQRGGTKPDTSAEARGSAREAAGNNARGTDGERGSDPTRNKVKKTRR